MLLHIRCKVRFISFRGCTFEVALAFLVVFNSLQTKHNFKIKKLLHQLILVSSVLYYSYLLYLYLTIFHKLKCVGNPNPNKGWKCINRLRLLGMAHYTWV